MPLDVAVYLMRGNGRSQKIGDAMACGIRLAGDRPIIRCDGQYRGQDEPVAVFYGYQRNHPQIMADYRAAGRKVVYLDLGYWGRHDGGRWAGYHKVAINDRHPTAHFRSRPHDPSRLARFGLRPKPWRTGKHILLAGMSDKAAATLGYGPEEWERRTVAEIRKHTDRPVIYRPKPSWTGARPIGGCGFSPKGQRLVDVLTDCHAVVTHHSNVAVDGLVEGIPAFVWDGVAQPMASQDLAEIETPRRPDGREQWMADIAWTQWNVAEMMNGRLWEHLKGEGLIPCG